MLHHRKRGSLEWRPRFKSTCISGAWEGAAPSAGAPVSIWLLLRLSPLRLYVKCPNSGPHHCSHRKLQKGSHVALSPYPSLSFNQLAMCNMEFVFLGKPNQAILLLRHKTKQTKTPLNSYPFLWGESQAPGAHGPLRSAQPTSAGPSPFTPASAFTPSGGHCWCDILHAAPLLPSCTWPPPPARFI